MITLGFRGWFQCRLATDPDPYDELRGVSGYVRAYVHEPPLDRVLYLQPPAFTRALAPQVGVTVSAVSVGDQEIASHPLLGARISFVGEPHFEGRNGVIAEDGMEPIYPFELRVQKDAVVLQRTVVAVDPEFPYAALFSTGIEGGPEVAAEIAALSGVSDLRSVWRERLQRLRELESKASGTSKVGLRERASTLETWLTGGLAGFFGVRMGYDYALDSAPTIEGWNEGFGGVLDRDAPWRAQFWLGGWDADALCGYCAGSIGLPTTAADTRPELGFRKDDREALMTGGVRR